MNAPATPSQGTRDQATSTDVRGSANAETLSKLGRKDSNLRLPDPESGDHDSGETWGDEHEGQPAPPLVASGSGNVRGLYQEDPIKERARKAVGRAVARGELVKPERCEGCQRRRTRVEAHHADYAKPLEVRWLCRPCHDRTHHPKPAKRPVARRISDARAKELGMVRGYIVPTETDYLSHALYCLRLRREVAVAVGMGPNAVAALTERIDTLRGGLRKWRIPGPALPQPPEVREGSPSWVAGERWPLTPEYRVKVPLGLYGRLERAGMLAARDLLRGEQG